MIRYLCLLSVIYLMVSESAIAGMKCSQVGQTEEMRDCLYDSYKFVVASWSNADISDDQIYSDMRNIALAYEEHPSLKGKEIREIWIGKESFPIQDTSGVEPDPTIRSGATSPEIFKHLSLQVVDPEKVRAHDQLLEEIAALSQDVSSASGIGDVRCQRLVKDDQCRDSLKQVLKLVNEAKRNGIRIGVKQLIIGNQTEINLPTRVVIAANSKTEKIERVFHIISSDESRIRRGSKGDQLQGNSGATGFR